MFMVITKRNEWNSALVKEKMAIYKGIKCKHHPLVTVTSHTLLVNVNQTQRFWHQTGRNRSLESFSWPVAFNDVLMDISWWNAGLFYSGCRRSDQLPAWIIRQQRMEIRKGKWTRHFREINILTNLSMEVWEWLYIL